MKKEGKGGAKAPGVAPWMATFSDLMNLLLCFFVLLFSMSSVDAEKFEAVIASLNSSFSIFDGGATSITEGNLISSGISQLNDFNDYYNNMGMKQEEDNQDVIDSMDKYKDKLKEDNINASEEMGNEIQDKINNTGISQNVDIQVEEYYVQLTLSGNLLFDSGKAQLKDGAISTLDKLGDILKYYEKYKIQIIGYTDTVPNNGGGKYDDNWELSSGRAYSVLKYLKNNKGMSEEKMECSGRGENDPVASNDTPEGREQNRRVEIRIYNKYSSQTE